MTESEALEILQSHQAILRDTHVVFTSGRHGNAYVNKDAIYPATSAISKLCRGIAEHFVNSNPDIVAAPAIGGIILSQWTAAHLVELGCPALSVYAEKVDDGFAFRRGYNQLITDRSVLVVEDIVTTGGSLKAVVESVRTEGGNVIGTGVLCNRGGVTPEQVAGPPELFALTNLQLETWDEAECPLCNGGVPVNTDVGKGREFLERQSAQ